MRLRLPKSIDYALSNKKWRVEKAKLRELRVPDGIYPFTTSNALNGNLLLDRTLTFPIQVINYDRLPIDQTYITKCIEIALYRRWQLAKEGRLSIEKDSAYRLLHENFDGLPGIAIDIFGRFALLHNYSNQWAPYINMIAHTLMRRSDLSLTGVYYVDHIRSADSSEEENEKNRKRSVCIAGRKAEQHTTIVTENGAKFLIRLDKGSAAGLYLDQRENRQKLVKLIQSLRTDSRTVNNSKQSSSSPTLLNAFCFTGSFSVFAALHGARTCNVDLSSQSLEIAKENFRLNNIDPRQHDWHNKDVFTLFPGFEKGDWFFDVVFLDPPTYARVRQKDGRKFTFSTENKYHLLLSQSAALVKPSGYLVAFLNTHSMTSLQWEKQLIQGFNSLVERKHQMENERRQIQYRSLLRKKFKEYVRKKQRLRLVAGKTWSLSTDDVRQLWGFEKIDEWTQSMDFGWLENDPQGQYLKGVVMQRAKGDSIEDIMKIIIEDLKKINVIDKDGKLIAKPISASKETSDSSSPEAANEEVKSNKESAPKKKKGNK